MRSATSVWLSPARVRAAISSRARASSGAWASYSARVCGSSSRRAFKSASSVIGESPQAVTGGFERLARGFLCLLDEHLHHGQPLPGARDVDGAGDALLFGAETRGLPQSMLDALPDANRVRLPMRPGSRSLNLSNAVAVVVYEAWRQCGFVRNQALAAGQERAGDDGDEPGGDQGQGKRAIGLHARILSGLMFRLEFRLEFRLVFGLVFGLVIVEVGWPRPTPAAPGKRATLC